jgi:hypothetical protein
MADKPKKLSDTARALLTVAATRGDHLIRPPKWPMVAARQVVRSLSMRDWWRRCHVAALTRVAPPNV